MLIKNESLFNFYEKLHDLKTAILECQKDVEDLRDASYLEILNSRKLQGSTQELTYEVERLMKIELKDNEE